MFAKSMWTHIARNSATAWSMARGVGRSGYSGAMRYAGRAMTSRYAKGAMAGAVIGGTAAVGEDFFGGNRIGIRRGIAMGAFAGLDVAAAGGLWARGMKGTALGVAGIGGYSLYRGLNRPNRPAGGR